MLTDFGVIAFEDFAVIWPMPLTKHVPLRNAFYKDIHHNSLLNILQDN
jgi:hypothetical protein